MMLALKNLRRFLFLKGSTLLLFLKDYYLFFETSLRHLKKLC